jgi:hypothetical protein
MATGDHIFQKACHAKQAYVGSGSKLTLSFLCLSQRAYRAHVRVVAAFKAFTVRKREVRNAFKHMDKAAAVVRPNELLSWSEDASLCGAS